MPASPDPSFLREIASLRAHLAECLCHLERLEQRLRGEPIPAGQLLADPFEQALPVSEASCEQETEGRFTIRDLPLSTAAPSPAADVPRTHMWATEPPARSGDGSPDPFAFLSISAPASPRDQASEVYRGVRALLGGLDVTTQDEPA